MFPFAKDTLQKLSLIAFAQAMLALMGDSRRIVRFYPTELIIPTFRKRFMDGVLELEDGSLMDMEFQTGNITVNFLLRCAQYSINLRVISDKYVETNIFSTGLRAKSKKLAFISRFFRFRPKLFFYEELTLMDRYNLVFIPLMGNVDRVKVAFEVFEIANDRMLFSEEEQSEIKRCQYIVAQIIAEDDEELLNKFWEIIRMNNDFLVKYETDLIDRTTKRVTEQVTEQVTQQVTEQVTEQVTKTVTKNVTRNIARNLKDVLSDVEIVKRTGLSINEVLKL